ncbi:hypothetical protein DLAC_01849 [Tieghemostelium lacteum]|uniref:Phosphatidic acid phosphatase type 2/haloperoxidase domain-containing protein n=1 Tax=Tieghemostelium lacteum TaxID=361077 RepID=A0A152A6H8_TIELA|nr:hypothetical protein DLAC_01849 [Tieghemostelium lacteum]|eukprot:KYR01832.1 hypothetical protein DLAC_01849 [Tieghemostelium lacteum]
MMILDNKPLMEQDDYNGNSTLFAPHRTKSILDGDTFTPLTANEFVQVYETSLSNRPKKKFVYLFPIWLEEKLRGFDDPIIRVCQKFTGKYSYYFSLIITSMVAIEIAFIAPFVLFILGQDPLATEFTYLGLLLALLSQVPKRFLWRFRPFMVRRAIIRKKDNTSSFPSRAVTCSVVYSYAICWTAYYYQQQAAEAEFGSSASVSQVQWWMPFLFIIMIALSSFARINLGVHYPSDCVGGVIQGTMVCLIGTSFRAIDVVGCRSCWNDSCYATTLSQTLSFSNLGRLNYVMFAILLALCIIIPIVSTMKPVDFWSKCDRVYGMLFPAVCFQLLFLCPKSYDISASLPHPPSPSWYSFMFSLSIALIAIILGGRIKVKYSLITFWGLFLTLTICLFSWRLALV